METHFSDISEREDAFTVAKNEVRFVNKLFDLAA